MQQDFPDPTYFFIVFREKGVYQILKLYIKNWQGGPANLQTCLKTVVLSRIRWGVVLPGASTRLAVLAWRDAGHLFECGSEKALCAKGKQLAYFRKR